MPGVGSCFGCFAALRRAAVLSCPPLPTTHAKDQPPHCCPAPANHTTSQPPGRTAPVPATAQGLLRESQQANERLQKEYSGLAEKVGRLHHSLEEHIHANTQLLADNSQRQVEIKGKEDEIRALRVSGGCQWGGRQWLLSWQWLCVVSCGRVGVGLVGVRLPGVLAVAGCPLLLPPAAAPCC